MKNELPDWHFILGAVLFLLAMGTVFVFSSTPMLESGARIRFSHLASVFLGLGLMFWLMRLDYRFLREYAFPLGLLAIGLLLAVLIFGVTINGATRWFRIGSLSFQPSEVAKVASVIFFADFFSRKQKKVKEFWHGFMPAVFYSSVVLGLIMFEPDLGTSVLLGGVIFCMLLVAGFRLVHIFPSIVVVVAAAVPFMLRYPHVSRRLGTFMSGEYDHQVTQGLMTLSAAAALQDSGWVTVCKSCATCPSRGRISRLLSLARKQVSSAVCLS
ncbi:MAG: FtsW/RodA/SpoVE family cell cycle protein [Planctomycetota bacterium]|nr:FtsW/RodA/SpoVE family cell cycle protein [Planctomycetota bacterium]